MSLEFKIKLEGSSKPPIWRKVRVNNSLSFFELHYVIQLVFDWEDEHIFLFSPAGFRSFPQMRYNYDDGMDHFDFENPESFPYGKYYDAEKITLRQYFQTEKKLTYIYDFGDNWHLSLALEKEDEELLMTPLCIKGKGNTPPEDCGGIWGYYDLVDVVNSPPAKKDPNRKTMREWLGLEADENWDLHYFDLEETNYHLRSFWTEYMKVKKGR